MIITITLNPAIDRTLIVDEPVEFGAVNSVVQSYVEVGGRGINVSRAIRSLGGECVALGFTAGNNGRSLKNALTALGITHDFTDVTGETRTNTQIVHPDGSHTDFNEPGTAVEDEDYLRFLEKLKLYLDPSNLFVLCGRIPRGMKEKQYLKIIKIIKKAGCSLLVDCDGDTMRSSLPYKPDFIKPNTVELAKLTGLARTHDPEEAYIHAKPLLEQGAQTICASLGWNGAIFLNPEEIPLYVVADAGPADKSAIASGDAMVGAIAHAYNQGMSYEEIAKFAVAMGTASVMLPGSQMATMKEAYEVYETIKVYTM
ncbi:MAG: 1-phosphofructokinase family hexose kinase [Eubacteriales bacterium]|nr:1-phosphofructokinase family hexose kinase [Eubacteriales bacterium]